MNHSSTLSGSKPARSRHVLHLLSVTSSSSSAISSSAFLLPSQNPQHPHRHSVAPPRPHDRSGGGSSLNSNRSGSHRKSANASQAEHRSSHRPCPPGAFDFTVTCMQSIGQATSCRCPQRNRKTPFHQGPESIIPQSIAHQPDGRQLPRARPQAQRSAHLHVGHSRRISPGSNDYSGLLPISLVAVSIDPDATWI